MIYVIESGEFFKVGFTAKNFEKYRAKAYNTHNPNWKLTMLMEGDYNLEVCLHKRLKGYNHRGEWFNKFDGWEDFIKDIIHHNTHKDFEGYNPYGDEVFSSVNTSDVFSMGLTDSEIKLWIYIVLYYNKSKGCEKMPSYIELDCNYLGKSIFKNRHDALKGILKLQSLDLLRKYNGRKNLYSASPKYVQY